MCRYSYNQTLIIVLCSYSMNSGYVSAQRGNNPLDWTPITPQLSDEDGLSPAGRDDTEDGLRPAGSDVTEDQGSTRLGVDETGSLPNVYPIADDGSDFAIDGPGFFGSDNQLLGAEVIVINEPSLDNFWNM